MNFKVLKIEREKGHAILELNYLNNKNNTCIMVTPFQNGVMFTPTEIRAHYMFSILFGHSS